VIFGQSGNLYGTVVQALEEPGPGFGTVFELSPNGSGGWTETTLYNFQGGSDGAQPGELAFDQAGNLYGATESGGGSTNCNAGCGTVFELSPNGNGSGGWTEAVLYSFQGGNEGDGANDLPSGLANGLVFDQSGNLYGTTVQGGGTGCGGSGCGVAYEVFREPFVTFSPASLNFGNQPVGIGSSPQVATLTNSGSLPLTITSIQITGANSGDFGQTNNCPSSMPPNSNCSINVTFTPAAAGNRSAAVSVTDNVPGSPQSLPLTGTGQDFSLAPSSASTATVAPGQAANYTVAVAPAGGFNQTVTFTCSGAPAQSTCSISPSSVTLNGATSTPVAVTVTTAGTSANLAPSGLPPIGNRFALWLAFSGLPGLVLLGSRRRKWRGRLLYGVACFCVLFTVMTWSACGGGSGSSGGGGTPAGTYNVTVAGTFSSGSANLVHSTKLTLVVQ
jgi:hypothetical protein